MFLAKRIPPLLLLLLIACAPATSATLSPVASTATFIPAVTDTPFTTLTPTAMPAWTATTTPLTPLATQTPDLRLPPEKWREWPVVPAVSARAIEIYRKGIELGNDPHHFSKVGDCQSVPAAFFGIYDDPTRYYFTDDYQYLQETVDWYAGSFAREGESVRGGFNAASVLLPLWADPKSCAAGETPLECEFRIHKPSVVIISLEVWYQGRTPDTYAGYLRQVIDFAISKGTLPILATKADNVEGDNSINAEVAKLAYEYDIPMWNFWRAVQPLPDHGIDWARDASGFHITVAAWNQRSFTALQTLDAVRRAAQSGTEGPASVAGDASTPVMPPVEIFASDPMGLQVTPAGAESDLRLAFDLGFRDLGQSGLPGVFSGRLDGADWSMLTGEGTQIQALSGDGKQALVSLGSQLYLADLAGRQAVLLRSDLYPHGPQSAVWLADGGVAFVAGDADQTAVYRMQADGSGATRLTPETVHPIELFPSPDLARVYWGSGSCDEASCQPGDAAWSSFDGSQTANLEGAVRPVFSSTGNMAWAVSTPKSNTLTTVVNGQSYSVAVPGNRVLAMAWSPDGHTLAVSSAVVSNYSGRILEDRVYLVSWPGMLDALAIPLDAASEHLLWSADGKTLLVVRRSLDPNVERMDFIPVNAATQYIIPAASFSMTGEHYFYLTHLFWLP
jgi:hypothetical protein